MQRRPPLPSAGEGWCEGARKYAPHASALRARIDSLLDRKPTVNESRARTEDRSDFRCLSVVAGRTITLAALLLAACASAPENPDARLCLPPKNAAMTASDYNIRLAGYTRRADAFAACMTERGYVLNEDQLEERMRHFEAVQNADVMGGDPLWAMRIHEQELRVDPALWRRKG